MNQTYGYFSNLGEVTAASLQAVWFKFLQYIPNIIGAIIILIIGWILASVLGNLVRRLIGATGVDRVVDRSGINARFGLSPNFHLLSRTVGWLVKWFIIIATLVAVAGTLNLPQITDFLNQIVAYIPRAVVAVIILTVGFLVADFISELISRGLAASRLPVSQQSMIAAVGRYGIIVFSIMAALTQLNIVPELIQILFGGIVLALALAFGLGGRDEAARLIQSLRQEQR